MARRTKKGGQGKKGSEAEFTAEQPSMVQPQPSLTGVLSPAGVESEMAHSDPEAKEFELLPNEPREEPNTEDDTRLNISPKPPELHSRASLDKDGGKREILQEEREFPEQEAPLGIDHLSQAPPSASSEPAGSILRADAPDEHWKGQSISDHPISSRMRSLRYVRLTHSFVFFLYAVLGVVALLTMKSLNLGFDIIIYFCVALTIMGSYFIINMMNLVGLRLRYDQLGDNIYYLGFIYTLGTLSHTLYIFQGNIDNIYEVISSFGIALSTTVLGVVLRIVAHLMRLDPHEVEDAVRSELIDLTSRVRASFDVMVRDFTVFGDQTRQAISELQNDVSKNVSGNVERLVAASSQVLDSIDQSFQAFTENTSRMNGLSAQTVTVLSSLVAKIEGIQAPSNLIEQKLLPATDQIERLVAAVTATAAEEEQRADRLRSTTEAMSSAIDAIHKNLSVISSAATQEEMASRLSTAASALSDMSQSVGEMRDQMKSLVTDEAQAMVGLRGQYEVAVANVRAQNVAMKAELDKFHSLTADTQDALIKLARALKEAV